MNRLFHLPLSPFCRKIRLVMAEKRQEVDLVEEPVWKKRLEFLKLNAAGKVPVLIINGKVLCESTSIFEYLEEIHPSPPLLPSEISKKAEARRLSSWFDDKFHGEVTSNLLYERVYKKISKTGHPDSDLIKEGAKKIKFHLDYMNWLLEKRRWLACDYMTIADFSAAAHLSCLDYINDVDWERSNLVKEWYAKIKSRPSFRSLLADVIPGFIPSTQYAELDF
tara:strand:+ start:26 stop:691 length:666 start_codon:yes stop_codon:yes gene_type:complete